MVIGALLIVQNRYSIFEINATCKRSVTRESSNVSGAFGAAQVPCLPFGTA